MLRSIKRKPRGVIVCAALLILGSLYKLFGFISYDYYVFMFQQLPSGQINDRYIMSVGLRIVGLVTALGLMCHRGWARRVMLFLCFSTIVTIGWKHPYSVFENISIYWEYQKGINQLPAGTITDQFAYPLYPPDISRHRLMNPTHPKISQIAYIVIDLVFCVSMLWYFCQPRIRKLFHPVKGRWFWQNI